MLIARIYEVFPLVCPICAGQMRLIAFITDGAEVCKILEHIGVDSQAPRISPARGPPLWDDCDAQAGKGVDVEPDWVRIRPNRTRLPSRPAHSLVKGKPVIRTRPGGACAWRSHKHTERLDQTAFLGGGLRKPDVPPEKRRFSYWFRGRYLG